MSNHRAIPELTETNLKRFWSKVDVREPDDCWEYTGGKLRDYGGHVIPSGTFLSHRLAYFIKHNVDPGKMLVCHTCDNPPCCNPAHLWLGTVGDNNRDMVAKGRHGKGGARGEKHPNAKLTEQDVREIRASDKSTNELVKQYSAKRQTIREAQLRVTWKHVK